MKTKEEITTMLNMERLRLEKVVQKESGFCEEKRALENRISILNWVLENEK